MLKKYLLSCAHFYFSISSICCYSPLLDQAVHSLKASLVPTMHLIVSGDAQERMDELSTSRDKEHHTVYMDHLWVLVPLFSLVREPSGTVLVHLQSTPSVSPGVTVGIP